MLEEQLADKDNKLREANEKELALRKRRINWKKKNRISPWKNKDSWMRKEQRSPKKPAKKATEEQRYIIAQLQKQLTDATKAKDDLARKLEQGSQQTQGEVFELELEELLKIEFPCDEILPVPKGVNGADIIQKGLRPFRPSLRADCLGIQKNQSLERGLDPKIKRRSTGGEGRSGCHRLRRPA